MQQQPSKKKIDIQALLDIPKRIPATVLPCIMQFDDNIGVCQSLVIGVHQSTNQINHTRLASHNLAVNLVSQVEVLCKRMVVEFKDIWDKSSYDGLLETKITFNEAFNLMQSINEVKDKKEILTLEHLISEFKTFYNFDTILNTFSTLLGGKNLYKELAVFKLNDGVSLESTFGADWQNEIRNVYNIRNRFVHEGALTENIDYVQLNDAAYYFGLVLYFYFHSLQPKSTIENLND